LVTINQCGILQAKAQIICDVTWERGSKPEEDKGVIEEKRKQEKGSHQFL